MGAVHGLRRYPTTARRGRHAWRAGQNFGIVKEGQKVRTVRLDGRKVVGEGRRVGSVHRLADGRTAFVEGR